MVEGTCTRTVVGALNEAIAAVVLDTVPPGRFHLPTSAPFKYMMAPWSSTLSMMTNPGTRVN
jgi:hypothetical protein